jgi:hypothetical protein
LINLKFIKHEISCNYSFDLSILNMDEFIEYLKEKINTNSELPLLKVNEILENEKLIFNNFNGYNTLRLLEGMEPIKYSN